MAASTVYDVEAEEESNIGKSEKSSGNSSFRPGIVVAMIVGATVLTVVAVVGVYLIGANKRTVAEREALRSKAEAVLKARFNDTASIEPLQSLNVDWGEDKKTLIVTWVEGTQVQKRCKAPVLIGQNENGQAFGIAPFEAVPFDEQGMAEAACTTTAGVEFGLPVE